MNEVGSSVEYINILLYIHIFIEWYRGRLSKHSSGNLVEQLLKGFCMLAALSCFFFSPLVITIAYIGKKTITTCALTNTKSTVRIFVLTVSIDLKSY